MEKNAKERIKKIGIILALLVGVIFIKYMMPVSPSEARRRLERYLVKEYKEEFVISFFGSRGKNDYEGVVYPKSYIGTRKLNDKYYEATGYYHEGKPGDNYNKVLTTEDTNEYFRPKLEELFGKNVLPVFQYEITWKKSTFEDLRAHLGERLKLDGAIYIFGTINTEEDIKKYQKGIFEFVQHLKEEKAFEYTKLAFVVIDERVLEDDFYKLKIKNKLIEAKKESKTEQEFLGKREEILSQIKITNSDKRERIENINRGEINKGAFLYYGYNTLGVSHVVSPQMMKAGHYKNLYKEEVGKTYEKVEEINMESFRLKD